MEGHLRAIALWDRVYGCLLILAGFGLLYEVRYSFGPDFMNLIAFVFMGAGVMLFVVGAGLHGYSNTARLIRGFLTIMACIGGGLGALSAMSGGCFGSIAQVLAFAWNVVILWALFNETSADICTQEYRDLVSETPDGKPRLLSSFIFWVPLAQVVLVMASIVWAFSGRPRLF